MKDIKMFVFDVGNTLVDTKSGMKISDKVLTDLFELKKKGYILGLSTLRNEDMISVILEQFSFDFLVLMNGGVVKVNGKIIFSCPLSGSDVECLEQWSESNNISVKEYSYKGEIYAIELINAKSRFNPSNKYQYYIWDNSGDVDITAKGVTKLNGVIAVCDEYSITLDNVAAFGDGFNDIETLNAVGFSVAMNGASNELLDIADMVTDSAYENGISTALRRMEVL